MLAKDPVALASPNLQLSYPFVATMICVCLMTGGLFSYTADKAVDFHGSVIGPRHKSRAKTLAEH
jgi:hypothetical protein